MSIFKRKNNKKLLKKVSRNFSGQCYLNQLPDNTLFRVIDRNGKVSKKTYIKEKGSYNRLSRKYDISDYNDINNFRSLKGTTKVTTDFIY